MKGEFLPLPEGMSEESIQLILNHVDQLNYIRQGLEIHRIMLCFVTCFLFTIVAPLGMVVVMDFQHYKSTSLQRKQVLHDNWLTQTLCSKHWRVHIRGGGKVMCFCLLD